ncbi:MAG TPA: hypothetical protein VJT78_03780 [Candidatus Dormibacteraeota bacterium]|nr:hypothetical protein [Candidatus Dormibacteraeota bacterium]
MVRLRRLVALVGGVILVGALSGGGTPLAASASSGPTFGNPTISGVQGTGFEQDLRIDRAGRIYTSAPGSLSSTISYVNRSFDGGQTFKWVAGAVQPFGKPTTCAGGGDSELATDSANNLYLADLTLANFSTARSGDHGRTFAPFTCASTPIAPVDRQWYAVDGNPTAGGSITLTYDFAPNLAGLPDPTCSSNNRVVFARSPIPAHGTTVVDPATAGILFGPNQIINTDPCNEGIMGNDEIFNYGGVKRAFVVHDNQNLDTILMGRCDLADFTVSPTGYDNCQDLVVSHFPGFITGANFPTMGVDRAGHLFAVWEQAPYDSVAGMVTGDTLLYYSVSRDQGNTWTPAVQLQTPNLHNNVFAWAAAGDNGRVDVAWYGTPAVAPNPSQGPDSVHGYWSLYLDQSLNFTSASPTWTGPILASEHFIHLGSMFTLIGHQTGDRTLGDFIQLRIGSQGEANISYADSNSIDELDAQAAFVRQNGGPSLYGSVGTVHLAPERFNSVQVGRHSATFDSAGVSSASQPNLEILGSQMRLVNSGQTLQIKMQVADLTTLAPRPDAGGSTLAWSTQWKVPSGTDPNGGKFFHAYMQSIGGAAPTFAVGENAIQQEGGGLLATYPGSTMVTGSYTATAPGVITINVPVADVTEPGALNTTLYSVTSASFSLAGTADGPNLNGIGGVPFNLVDTAPAYDFNPSQTTPVFSSCHEQDGDGTMRGQHGGSATFHSDEDSCDDGAPNGEQFNDPGAGEAFYSTVTSSVVYDDVMGTVSIIGEGVANGTPVAFTIVETEATALSGARYAISLSDGYVNGGDLVSGTIRLA